MLAGIPADPSRFDPGDEPDERQSQAARGAEGDARAGRDLGARHETRRRAPAAEGGRRPPAGDRRAGALLRQLREAAVDREVRNPASVRRRPRCADRRSTSGCRSTRDRRSSRILKEPNGPSAALVSIRPSTGEVVAMYGGDNFRQSQFNLAVQGERQAGSSFKPFVLATALKEGVSPATTFPSKPVSIFIGDKYWPVHNYENSYLGSADLTTATVVSDNTVFAQLTRPRRAGQGRGDGAAARHHPASESVLRDRPRRRSPSARSRWRARSRRSRTAAAASTARSSATTPVRWRGSATPEGKVIDNNRPVNRACADSAIRTRCSRASSKASSARAPESARLFRTESSPGRPGRPRTTATPGSSDTHRSSQRPCGSATRTS